MNYIIYGTDGRVIKTNFTELIQQGNNNVNEIFVSIQGVDAADYTVSGLFTLPDNTSTTEIGVLEQNCEYESGVYADGYLITITEDETKYAGRVFLSIQLLNASDNSVLYTYKVVLTINETGVATDITSISLDQYTNLLTYLSTQLGLKEDLANKVTSLSSGSTDDEYPSAKCVYDLLKDRIPIIQVANGTTISNASNLGKPYIMQFYNGKFFLTRITFTGGGSSYWVFEFENLLNKDRFEGQTADGTTTINTILDTSGSYYKPYLLAEDISYDNVIDGVIAEHIGYSSGGTLVKEEGGIPHLYRHSIVITDIDDYEFLDVYITSNSSVPLTDVNSVAAALDDSGTIEVRLYDVQNEENAVYIQTIQTAQDTYRIFMASFQVAQTYIIIADDDTFTDTVERIL